MSIPLPAAMNGSSLANTAYSRRGSKSNFIRDTDEPLGDSTKSDDHRLHEKQPRNRYAKPRLFFLLSVTLLMLFNYKNIQTRKLNIARSGKYIHDLLITPVEAILAQQGGSISFPEKAFLVHRILEKKRKHPTKITWIKAHSGKFGNAVADELAGHYFHPEEELPLSQYYECPEANDISTSVTLTIFHDETTQYPIRTCLKQIHRLRDQKEGQPHLSKHNISNENDWGYTLSVVNDGVKTTSRVTERRAHYSRAFSYKMLAFILPVQARLFSWFPYLYPDALCRLCHKEIEDNLHVWTCKSLYAIGRRTEILDNARKLLLKIIIGPATNHHFKHIIELTLNRIYCISTSPSSLKTCSSSSPPYRKRGRKK
jgi:hypothetical protein